MRSSTLKLTALYGAAAAGIIALAVGVASLQESAHPSSEGSQYLQQQGFTRVEGGERSAFNGCGKGVMGRRYVVTNPNTHQRETATVCFSLFGPRRPLFGG